MMATPRQQLEMKALEEQLEQSQAKVSQLESELTTVASEQEEKLKVDINFNTHVYLSIICFFIFFTLFYCIFQITIYSTF